MDPDQTDLDLHCLLKWLQKHVRRRQKQATFGVFGTVGVDKCNFQFIYGQKVHECTHVCAAQTPYQPC